MANDTTVLNLAEVIAAQHRQINRLSADVVAYKDVAEKQEQEIMELEQEVDRLRALANATFAHAHDHEHEEEMHTHEP